VQSVLQLLQQGNGKSMETLTVALGGSRLSDSRRACADRAQRPAAAISASAESGDRQQWHGRAPVPASPAGSLRRAGIEVVEIILPDGEQFKNWQTLNTIFDALLQRRCERSTT
jgi:hypothetical protein